MPELPEIHTITTDLAKYVKGAVVVETVIASGYEPSAKKQLLLAQTNGYTIKNVQQLAKNIVIELSSGFYLVIHLAMTGRLLLRTQGFSPDNWQRVTFFLEKNGKKFELRFCDKRKFGKVDVLTAKELEELRNGYGPTPLDHDLDALKLHTRLKMKKTAIKNVLLDQKIISGVGNAYANDALWLASLHPQTSTHQLNLTQAEKLLDALREILTEGIKNRGISMSDYVDLFGKPGKQQEYFRIYRQENCLKCKNKVEFMQLNGRGTYFCLTCQPSQSS